jgi:hypothetical protein
VLFETKQCTSGWFHLDKRNSALLYKSKSIRHAAQMECDPTNFNWVTYQCIVRPAGKSRSPLSLGNYSADVAGSEIECSAFLGGIGAAVVETGHARFVANDVIQQGIDDVCRVLRRSSQTSSSASFERDQPE